MATKPNQHNWRDIQTAMTATAVVATLGLWNLFATPTPKPKPQMEDSPAPTDEPVVDVTPTPLPYIKIIFSTPKVAQPVTSFQPVQIPKKHKNKNGGGGGGSVTTTKTS